MQKYPVGKWDFYFDRRAPCKAKGEIEKMHVLKQTHGCFLPIEVKEKTWGLMVFLPVHHIWRIIIVFLDIYGSFLGRKE